VLHGTGKSPSWPPHLSGSRWPSGLRCLKRRSSTT